MDARVRKNLTIVACVTPVLAPLAFMFAFESQILDWLLQLIQPIIGVISIYKATGLFSIGWLGWTLLCSTWVAWQMVQEPTATPAPWTRLGPFIVFVALVIFFLWLFVLAASVSLLMLKGVYPVH